MVDDCAALQAQLAAATAPVWVWLPRVHDRLERAAAVGERPLDAGAAGWRELPHTAYAHHWAGRFDRAGQLRTEALRLADTAARGATTHHHIDRRRFGQGDGSGAPVELETARRVRAQAGAARNLSVSSARAAHPARERAGR